MPRCNDSGRFGQWQQSGANAAGRRSLPGAPWRRHPELPMSTFYVYLLDTLDYLGAVEAADREVAWLLASAVWPVPVKVLTWRLRLADSVPA